MNIMPYLIKLLGVVIFAYLGIAILIIGSGFIMLPIAIIKIIAGNTKKSVMLKKIDTTAFSKLDYDMNFEFKCSYCGKMINTKDKTCPSCGGTYATNKDYLDKKYERNVEYLKLLKKQEEELDKLAKNFENNNKLIKKNNSLFLKRSFYKMPINYIDKKYEAKEYFEFNCEYCHATIKGTSKDKEGCSNCGASYSDNKELLVQEEEERLIKRNISIHNLIQSDMEIENKINNSKDREDNAKSFKVVRIIGNILKGLLIIGAIDIVAIIIVGIIELITKMKIS